MKYKVVVYYDNMEDSEHVFSNKNDAINELHRLRGVKYRNARKYKFEINLYREVCRSEENYNCGGLTDFQEWLISGKTNPLSVLVNMHQFGYEVEKEKRYTVVIKAVLGQYLGRYYLNNEELTPQFSRTQFTVDEERPTFTRKELEDAGFGWVFDCEGIEIEEIKNRKGKMINGTFVKEEDL